MTKEKMLELSKEAYANVRRDFLEKNAPEFLKAMEENGTLTEHLATVEELVGDYIDRRCEEVQKTERYINADEITKIRIMQSEHVFARQDAFLMYVYVLPEEEYVDDDDNYSEGSDNEETGDED